MCIIAIVLVPLAGVALGGPFFVTQAEGMQLFNFIGEAIVLIVVSVLMWFKLSDFGEACGQESFEAKMVKRISGLFLVAPAVIALVVWFGTGTFVVLTGGTDSDQGLSGPVSGAEVDVLTSAVQYTDGKETASYRYARDERGVVERVDSYMRDSGACVQQVHNDDDGYPVAVKSYVPMLFLGVGGGNHMPAATFDVEKSSGLADKVTGEITVYRSEKGYSSDDGLTWKSSLQHVKDSFEYGDNGWLSHIDSCVFDEEGRLVDFGDMSVTWNESENGDPVSISWEGADFVQDESKYTVQDVPSRRVVEVTCDAAGNVTSADMGDTRWEFGYERIEDPAPAIAAGPLPISMLIANEEKSLRYYPAALMLNSPLPFTFS